MTPQTFQWTNSIEKGYINKTPSKKDFIEKWNNHLTRQVVKAYEIEFTVDNCSEDEKSEFQLGSGGKS